MTDRHRCPLTPGRKITRNVTSRSVVFPGRFDREFYQGRRVEGMPSVPVRAEIERFIDFFNEFLECFTLLHQPSHLPDLSSHLFLYPLLLPSFPLHPWIWSTDPDPPKRAPFSESLISVLLAFFFSNQPDSRRIWSKRPRGQGQTDWRLRIIYDTITSIQRKSKPPREGRRRTPFRIHAITIFYDWIDPHFYLLISIVLIILTSKEFQWRGWSLLEHFVALIRRIFSK